MNLKHYLEFVSLPNGLGYKTDDLMKRSILVIGSNKIYPDLDRNMNDIMVESSKSRDILLMTMSKSRLKSVGMMLSHEKSSLEGPE